MSATFDQKLEAFARVLKTMDELRAKCPWDKKQTNDTLRTLTIEEVYELSDAVLQKEPADICQELGDILLHIVFYSKIGEENNQFDVAKVCDTLVEKLVRRHPHIYGDVKVNNDQDVKDNWEKIKLDTGSSSTLAGVPDGLPSLIKAWRIQDKARGMGFDWDNSQQVWDKMNEELGEFKDEINKPDQDRQRIEDEFGDILFALVNYARFFGVNPDDALERTNKRFITRFSLMEKEISSDGKKLKEMDINEMEQYWQKVKKIANSK